MFDIIDYNQNSFSNALWNEILASLDPRWPGFSGCSDGPMLIEKGAES